MHPTRGAGVYVGSARLGVVGELHPDVCERFAVPERTVFFEIDAETLLRSLPERPVAAPLSRFPSMYLDIALVVDEAVEAARVEDVVRRAGEPEVVSTRLFDLYRGDQVAPGKKSLAFALELRSPERTMTDEEAARVRDRIVNAARERTGAELRA